MKEIHYFSAEGLPNRSTHRVFWSDLLLTQMHISTKPIYIQNDICLLQRVINEEGIRSIIKIDALQFSYGEFYLENLCTIEVSYGFEVCDYSIKLPVIEGDIIEFTIVPPEYDYRFVIIQAKLVGFPFLDDNPSTTYNNIQNNKLPKV